MERPIVERQGRHVLAELDLVGRARPEEVGDGRVGLLDDRVGALARRERAVVRWRSCRGSRPTTASITRCGTCVPPGPSRKATGRPSCSRASAGNSARRAVDIERGVGAHAILRDDATQDGERTRPTGRPARPQCSVVPVKVQPSMRTAGTTTPPRKPLSVRRSLDDRDGPGERLEVALREPQVPDRRDDPCRPRRGTSRRGSCRSRWRASGGPGSCSGSGSRAGRDPGRR